VTRRWGRRRKQLLDDLKEKREYCKLKEEALDRTMCGTRYGGSSGPVARQATEVTDSETQVLCTSLACCVGNGLHHYSYHNMRCDCFPSTSFLQCKF
jgi:hypothetical protein